MPQRSLTPASKVGGLVALAVIAAAGAGALPAIPQDPAYHDFADQRALLGIPNFANVASNAGFLAVGALGLAYTLGRRGRAALSAPQEHWPFAAFFAGVVLIAAGSVYYHLEPTTETLFWDRLPIAVSFMALLAAFIADRIKLRPGVRVALPLLPALGLAGVLHWRLSEAAGHGDLGFYLLAQIYPLLAIPLICLLFPGRRTSGRHVVAMIAIYAAAVACERYDDRVHALLAGAVSGHTLKHLLAAVAIAMVLLMLRRAPANGARAGASPADIQVGT